MKYAVQTSTGGKDQIVDANGNALGNGDADYPVLHILPKLFVPTNALPKSKLSPGWITPYNVALEVSTTLPCNIQPSGRIHIRQPYPNRSYFVGGSDLLRNGWTVPLPLDATEFDLVFRWMFEGVWKVFRQDDWEVRHVIHIRLRPGTGTTYTMDASCWPGAGRHSGAIARIGKGLIPYDEHRRRQIDVERDLVYTSGDEKGALAGYLIEERMDIVGIPLDKVWSMHAFEDEQLHEIEQTALLKRDKAAHRANALIELPGELFVRAVNLATEIPFDGKSDFAQSVRGAMGGLERHPALQLLCQWWEGVRPAGEPLAPGTVDCWVRARDDGEYWNLYYETPNATIEQLNPGGKDCALVGDLLLIGFVGTQTAARFDDGRGMTMLMPSGREYKTVGVEEAMVRSGEFDEAWYSLEGLRSFPQRFPVAWDFMNNRGSEYRRAQRSLVARSVPTPEGMALCPNCQGVPTVTEDPTEPPLHWRFMLTCCNDTECGADTIGELVELWQCDLENGPDQQEPSL